MFSQMSLNVFSGNEKKWGNVLVIIINPEINKMILPIWAVIEPRLAINTIIILKINNTKYTSFNNK